MSLASDYYTILGVARDADDDEIKRQYRKLAMRYHPDKNPNDKQATERFQEIAEAFHVLSDRERKDVYDRFGRDGLSNETEEEMAHGGAGPADPAGSRSDSYHGFQGNASDMFRQFFANGYATASNQPPPIIHDIALTLEELFAGITKKMKVTRIRAGQPDAVLLHIAVRPGSRAGAHIRYAHEGDELPDQVPADIIFVIQEKPHPTFLRVGSNLVHSVNVTLKQALTGFAVEVVGIDNQRLRIRVKPLTTSTYKKTVPGHGMPLSQKPDSRGDLQLQFVVEFPALSEQHKEQICAILP